MTEDEQKAMKRMKAFQKAEQLLLEGQQMLATFAMPEGVKSSRLAAAKVLLANLTKQLGKDVVEAYFLEADAQDKMHRASEWPESSQLH